MTGLSVPTLVRALWLAEDFCTSCIGVRGWATDHKGNEGIAVDDDYWALAYQRGRQRAGRIGTALFAKLGMAPDDPAQSAFLSSPWFSWDHRHCTGPDWERDKIWNTEHKAVAE